MGGRRQSSPGDSDVLAYQSKSNRSDVASRPTILSSRIRHWYAMQTDRLRRSDAIRLNPPPHSKNHDGAPAATATSPLSKRKVFGGRKWGLPGFRKSSQGKLGEPVATNSSNSVTPLSVSSSSNNNSSSSNNRLPPPFRKTQSDRKFKAIPKSGEGSN
ncbi:hypothetical protein OUZ56_028480 [Daphnia magna]|uniref:Uncharacterized protein n=1 Tax=Daphnia magna TaxID=35525 RepID=A0ABR0B400_9CRUS|nr:hypothetical protein OUZ56_028480 [Daphnia magna]